MCNEYYKLYNEYFKLYNEYCKLLNSISCNCPKCNCPKPDESFIKRTCEQGCGCCSLDINCVCNYVLKPKQ